MKVILLTDVPKVGNRYEIKELKDGFAQNVLIAKGLAMMATPKALVNLEKKRLEANQKREEDLKAFEAIVSTINNKKIEIKAKANEKGHLFKAISPKDVVFSIKDTTGIEVEEDSVKMDNIKEVGNHFIEIRKGDKKGKCEVIVSKE